MNHGLDDFAQDFQGGKIWLILFYFLFDTADFNSIKELLQLIKYSHPKHERYNLVLDKIISSYHRYLDSKNEFGDFVNIASIHLNSNVMNFALLLQFAETKSNITMTDKHIEHQQLKIKSLMELVTTIMSKLSLNINVSTFTKEAISIEKKIKQFRYKKRELIIQHRKWESMKERFHRRLCTELQKFKAGKINFLYEPTYPHYIIKSIVRIPFNKVKTIYNGYFNHETKMENDFESTLKNMKKGMGVIYALLRRYTTEHGAKLSFLKWEKMIYDCKLFNDQIMKRNQYVFKQLFREIYEHSQLSDNTQQFTPKCYQQYIKSVSSNFNHLHVQLMIMDAQYFGLLLIYVAQIMYFEYKDMAPSDKLEILLQQHLLKIVHPKSDIIALTNVHMIQLLKRQKSKSLHRIWIKCKLIERQNMESMQTDMKNNQILFKNDLIDTVSIESIIRLLRTHIESASYSNLVKLCQTCASYKDKTRADKHELFSIICYIGQQMMEQSSWKPIDEKIASFINKLCKN